MSKQTAPPRRRPRSLTHSELHNIAAEFERLSRQLEGATDTLRAAPENPLVIGDMRLSLSLAGRSLLKVLHHGAIDGPNRMPPWLSWSVRSSSRRPRFSGLRASIEYFGGRRKLGGLIQQLMASHYLASAPPSELPDTSIRFRHRQVFLESAAGWLGQRCNPRVSLHLPLAKAAFASDTPTEGSTGTARSVAITFDWDAQSPTKTRSLFLEIGRAASAACRHLAHSLQPSPTAKTLMTAKPEQPRTPTEVLHALQDLMTEASWKRGEAVHAALFGDGGIHTDLVALAAKRPEFELRPSGPIHKLTHFAVASGHEALARWCERVEGSARVRKSGLPRSQTELADARRAGIAALVALREVHYQKSVEYFAESITNALEGFHEDFQWIERAIRAEAIAATETRLATFSNPARVSTRRPRAHDDTKRGVGAVELKILAKLNDAENRTLKKYMLVAQLGGSGLGLCTIERRLRHMKQLTPPLVFQVRRGEWQITKDGAAALEENGPRSRQSASVSVTKRQSSR